MKIHDLLSFSKENYYNGAIQTDWFYDNSKARAIAGSYVFHGPKYFGVGRSDVSLGQHKLIDTASFAKCITERLYSHASDPNLLMTIAGYGTGKSHLAVTLGTLYGHNFEDRAVVTEHLYEVDSEIGTYIRTTNIKSNLVVTLNGMNNFNLDYEVLKCAKASLLLHGRDDSELRKLTKSYEIAKHFVDKTFSMFQAQFEKRASVEGINATGPALKEWLLAELDTAPVAFGIVNSVYTEINGDSIQWERGISAGDVLNTLSLNLCGENKPFNKVLVLFDEFGRYIEYAATNPAIAGDAALQQIFESVQGSSGNIVFVGFIQSDLSTYLSRIEKTANIIRYTGRYENAEKYYLSSNFETILANLIKKENEAQFQSYICSAINRYEKFHQNMIKALNRWDRSAYKKSVWKDYSLYKSVILNGCYPIHPITTWLLSNTSSWMQQRSTIAFTAEMFDSISNAEIESAWLPYVYPIDIIDSNIYNEMLNSEEKGLVTSQYCMLYQEIILKTGDKLAVDEVKVLKAILIVNVAKFVFLDRFDAITALHYCTGLTEDDIIPTVKTLEDSHGVIAFDESAHTFDLIAEANGFNEFKRIYNKYRIGNSASIDEYDEEISSILALDKDIETSFAQEHNISSTEWSYAKKIVDSKNVTESYITMLVRSIENNTSSEQSKGSLVYVYCDKNTDSEIGRLSQLIKKYGVEKHPIIFLLLDDAESEILTAMTIRKTLQRFSVADHERLNKHIVLQNNAQIKKICSTFTRLVTKREMITLDGVCSYEGRVNTLCSTTFNRIYTQAPSFAFDGFEKKSTVQANKYLTNICIKLYDSTLMNLQSYQALTQDEKNRVKSVLSTGVSTSWQVFDPQCQLVIPQNGLMRSIYDEIDSQLSFDEPISIWSLTKKFTLAPYGMNMNALALFIVYFIAHKAKNLLAFYGQDKLIASHFSDMIFKQNKVQLKELLKIKLQMNTNATVDIVAATCTEIMNNQLVEHCASLKKCLLDAVSQEGTTNENELLVAQARIRLDDGDKLYNRLYLNLAEAKAIIVDAESSFIIHKFIKVFGYLDIVEGKIEEGSSYQYSLEYLANVKSLVETSKNIISEKFDAALRKLTCNITQLSQIKTIYKKVALVLAQNGYIKEADDVNNRISTIENEIIVKQKYETSIVECDRDILLCADASAFTYSHCLDMMSKLQIWGQFFSKQSDVPDVLKDEFRKKLNKAIGSMQSRIDGLNNACDEAIASLQSATSSTQMAKIKVQIDGLISQELSEGLTSSLLHALDDIENAYNSINDMPQDIDSLHMSIKQLHRDSAMCAKVIECEYQARVVELEKKEILWVNTFINQIETSVNSMSTSDCSNWLDKTSVLPEYLQCKTKLQYQAAQKLVENQLHKARVQGVVSMFSRLSQSEKEECLRILNSNSI